MKKRESNERLEKSHFSWRVALFGVRHCAGGLFTEVECTKIRPALRDYDCQGVLERLLQIKIDHIEYPELQKVISPFYMRKGVRLDVYVANSDKVFDVECQSYKVENIGKRTRYYQSMIDIDSLMKGADYSELKESFVIFICTDDPFEKKLPVYTFERKCKENESVDFEDQTHHIVFNAAAYADEKNPEIKDFLSFVKNNKAESDFTRGIANMVQTKKFEQTFVNEYLAWNLHDQDVERRGKLEGRKEGRLEGIQEANTETAKRLMALGIPIDTITQATGLSLEFVKTL